jgi:hypothetical protein
MNRSTYGWALAILTIGEAGMAYSLLPEPIAGTAPKAKKQSAPQPAKMPSSAATYRAASAVPLRRLRAPLHS